MKSISILIVILFVVFSLPGCAEQAPPVSTPVSTPTPELTPTPAEFTISSLSVTPSEVKPGQQITISVVVTNTGGSEGSYAVILKINDVEEERKQITIEAGKSETIDFYVVRDEEGNYQVTIDDKVGQFSVSVPTPTYTPPAPTLPSIVWTTPSAPVTLTVDAAANRAVYVSGGTQVSGYFYKPQGTGPFPAVLVLHGRAGLEETHRSYASWLATQGYVALAPDYLTPIGVAGGQWSLTDWQNEIDPAREVMGLGIEALKSLSYVAPNRIGVVGFSLGGYFGCILATRDDVRGVVSYYGAYNGSPVTQNPNRYTFTEVVTEIKAPVLMFHGDVDTLVLIALANTTSDLLKSKGKEYEYIVYPGARHLFNFQGAPTPEETTATTDAQQKVLAFF